MAYRNLVIINGEIKDLKEFTEEERQKMAERWNRQAAATVNYKEKTA